MKVLIMTDLEGVSGVVSFVDQAYPDGKYYEQAKKLLTAEVNAAVKGLVEEGVDDILVIDGHGPGGIVFEELHPAAKLMHGRPSAPQSVYRKYASQYDVTIMVGQHAVAGTDQATLNHTQNSRSVDYYKLNGKYIGEIAQWALYCGGMNIPLIFLSGDEAACREAEDLIPGITTAVVKIGLARTYAISLSKEEAQSRIYQKVKQAVQTHRKNPIQPLRWEGPFVLEKRFMTTTDADSSMSKPGYERVDSQTVRLRSDDIMEIIYG